VDSSIPVSFSLIDRLCNFRNRSLSVWLRRPGIGAFVEIQTSGDCERKRDAIMRTRLSDTQYARCMFAVLELAESSVAGFASHPVSDIHSRRTGSVGVRLGRRYLPHTPEDSHCR